MPGLARSNRFRCKVEAQRLFFTCNQINRLRLRQSLTIALDADLDRIVLPNTTGWQVFGSESTQSTGRLRLATRKGHLGVSWNLNRQCGLHIRRVHVKCQLGIFTGLQLNFFHLFKRLAISHNLNLDLVGVRFTLLQSTRNVPTLSARARSSYTVDEYFRVLRNTNGQRGTGTIGSGPEIAGNGTARRAVRRTRAAGSVLSWSCFHWSFFRLTGRGVVSATASTR